MGAEFTQSPVFKLCVHKVFKKLDADDSGTIDREELLVAMCHLHYSLSSKSPGVTEAPTSAKVREMMVENDVDGSGTLSEEEFAEFAAKWYERNGCEFVGRVVLSSVVSMVLLPGLAGVVHKRVPGMGVVPRALFKVAFGVALKLFMMNVPEKV